MVEFTSIDEIVQETFDLSLSLTSISSGSSGSASTSMSPPPATTNTTPTFMVRGQKPRPQVTLLFEQSLDGRLLTNRNDNELLRQLNHRLRSKHDAVLIDVNTIKKNTSNNNAFDGLNFSPIKREDQIRKNGEQSRLIILDIDLEISLLNSNITDGNKRSIIVFYRENRENNERAMKLKEETHSDIQMIPVKCKEKDDQGDDFLSFILNILQILWEQKGIKKLLVEGDLNILQSFLRGSLFDKIIMIINPLFSGGNGILTAFKPEEIPKISNLHYQLLGKDLIMLAEPLLESK